MYVSMYVHKLYRNLRHTDIISINLPIIFSTNKYISCISASLLRFLVLKYQPIAHTAANTINKNTDNVTSYLVANTIHIHKF